MDLRTLLQAAVTSIYFDSNYGPHVEVEDPFKSTGKTDPYLLALQPRLQINTPAGPIVLEPYGAPKPTKWPMVKVGLAVTVAFAVVGVISTTKLVLKKR